MKAHRVLIVEDDNTLKTALFRLITKEGFQVVTATTISETQLLINSQSKWDLVVLDLNLPEGDSSDLIQVIKRSNTETKVIVITGQPTIDSAVIATQKGADQYISKPFEVSQILNFLKKHFKHNLEEQNQSIPSGIQKHPNPIIGSSDQIQDVLKLVQKVSNSDSTVLITGESGTGKELIAKSIHINSKRKNNPFVAINCGAIPMELLESELFGHVKGAFTGAIANRIGRFEMADGGTLFLDEIGDMHPSLQVKLLRVLQEKSFEPVGSTKTINANVRVITATHVNLEKAVSEGRFREDLYYRLNVIPIHVPSLRDRVSDISILVQHFLNRFSKYNSNNEHLLGFSPEAMAQLQKYSWPGNIRELENLIERMSILKGSGIIQVDELPLKYQSPTQNLQNYNSQQQINPTLTGVPNQDLTSENLDFNSAVDMYENQLILKALEKTGWNRNQAAILLKLNRTTLVEKIKKKGLKPPDDLNINLLDA